jgi:hypothetical protein
MYVEGICPYFGTAGRVILVAGNQTIVPDLETALRRIHDYVLPWEVAQVCKPNTMGTFIGKILIVELEWVNARMTVLLVREPIGIYKEASRLVTCEQDRVRTSKTG